MWNSELKGIKIIYALLFFNIFLLQGCSNQNPIVKLLGLSAQAPKINEENKLIIKEYFSENFNISGECSKKLTSLSIKIDDGEWKAPTEYGLSGDHSCTEDGLYTFSGLATDYGFIDTTDFKTVALQIKGENEFGESGVASMSLVYKAENNELIKPTLWEEVPQRTSNKIELKILTTDSRVKRLELYKTTGSTDPTCSSGSQLLKDPEDTDNFQTTGSYSVWHTEENLDSGQRYNFVVCGFDQSGTRTVMSDSLSIITKVEVQHYGLSGAGNSLWGEYAVNSNLLDYYSSVYLGNACVSGDVVDSSECVHLAELKKVSLPSYSSCDGLNAIDYLRLFNWTCTVEGGRVEFKAQGFNQKKSLRDAIDFNSADWKNNKIIILDNGSKITESSLEPWWQNSIEKVTTQEQALTSDKTVYIYDGDLAVNKVTIGGSSISLIIQKGVSFDGMNSSSSPGINVESSEFVWIEGDLENYPNSAAIGVSNSKFVNLNDLKVLNNSTGVNIFGSKFVKLQNSKLAFNYYGLNVSNSSFLTINNNHIYNNLYDGIKFMSGTLNVRTINNVMANNNNGLRVQVDLDGTNYFAFTTVINNQSNGILFLNNQAAGVKYINNIFLQNNGQYGMEYGNGFAASTNTHLSNLLSMNNAKEGFRFLQLDDSSTYVTGHIYNEGTNSAYPAGDPVPAILVDRLFDNSTTWEDSLVGEVTSDSVLSFIEKNGSNITLQYLGFQNEDRLWTKKGLAPYPSADQQGNCKSTECKLMDTSIRSTASLIGRASDHTLLSPQRFRVGAACPDSVDPTDNNNVSTSGPKKFLIYAVEITDDFLGNNDGFCESNERCVWSPNIGAYQGHGDLVYSKTCSFTSSTDFSNIKLIAYPNNGR